VLLGPREREQSADLVEIIGLEVVAVVRREAELLGLVLVQAIGLRRERVGWKPSRD